MKRMIAAIALIALLVAITVFSYFKINALTDEMTNTLHKAERYHTMMDYTEATKMLEECEKLFEQNEALFIQFVDREHYNNMNVSLRGLFAYVGTDTPSDFNSEMNKTLKYVDVIRNCNSKLI